MSTLNKDAFKAVFGYDGSLVAREAPGCGYDTCNEECCASRLYPRCRKWWYDEFRTFIAEESLSEMMGSLIFLKGVLKMSIREFVKSCAKKAKSFVIRCWKKAKQFIADHTREIKTVCGRVCLFASGALLSYVVYKARQDVKEAKGAEEGLATFLEGCNARAGMGLSGAEDLAKPDWGKGYDIQEHWTEKNRGNGVMDRMMILDTFLPHLGELGEKLIEDDKCGANPDLPVSLILGYGVG